MPDEVTAVSRTYDLILWAVPQVSKFPRDHRFGLGDRTVGHLYDLLELLLEASYSRDKARLLGQANLEVDKLRYMLRLAKDLRVLSINRYEHGVRVLDDIGRQVGGWRKACAAGAARGDA